jgi:PAS domain S-box-containing protein
MKESPDFQQKQNLVKSLSLKNPLRSKDFNPVKRMILVLLSSIFLSELFIMLIGRSLKFQLSWFEAPIDSFLLTILIFPSIYFLVIRPMTIQITARKHAEKEIKTILHTTIDGFYLVDTEGRILETNDSYCSMIGYSREELLKMSVKDIEAVDSEEVIKKRIQQILLTGYGYFETRHLRKDGSVIDIEASVNFLAEEQPKIFCFMRDITERKQAEKALLESNEDLEIHIKERTSELELVNIALQTQITERRQAEEELKNANDKLEQRVIQRTEELKRINNDLQTDIIKRKQAEEKIIHIKELQEEFNHRLDEIRENERATISREIHDQLGQSLTALKIDLIWLSGKITGGSEEGAKLKGMFELVTATSKDIQRISSELRPPILDDLGLAAALEWYCEEFANRTGLQVQMDLDDVQTEKMSKNLTIYRVLQESLTNIIRHAGAQNVQVKLGKNEEDIVLIIQDDGIGISPDKIKSSKSLGILGMFERVKHSDGHIEITTPDIGGTDIRISIPIN